MDSEKTGAGGSFTTELAAFFPVVIILILALMQMGMWFARRALVTAVSEEAVCLCGWGREKLLSQEEACALADEYLRSALSSLDTDDVSWYWEWDSGILKETMTLKVEGRYGLILSLSYGLKMEKDCMNRQRFRNRVDAICELWENSGEQ